MSKGLALSRTSHSAILRYFALTAVGVALVLVVIQPGPLLVGLPFGLGLGWWIGRRSGRGAPARMSEWVLVMLMFVGWFLVPAILKPLGEAIYYGLIANLLAAVGALLLSELRTRTELRG